jgi:hypothetical protein
MNETTPEPTLAPPTPPAPQESSTDDGWSWGAFVLGPIYLIAIRRYLLLAPYILLLVPILNIFVFLGYGIFLGIKGRDMASHSTSFANRDQYIGFMKGVDHAGKVFFFVYVAIIVVTLVLATTVLSSLGGARERAREASERQQAAMEQVERELEAELGADWETNL